MFAAGMRRKGARRQRLVAPLFGVFKGMSAHGARLAREMKPSARRRRRLPATRRRTSKRSTISSANSRAQARKRRRRNPWRMCRADTRP